MTRRRVVITGLGVIAPNGIGKAEFWDAIKNGKSGIDLITKFNPSCFPTRIAPGVLFSKSGSNNIKIMNRS